MILQIESKAPKARRARCRSELSISVGPEAWLSARVPTKEGI